MEGKNSPNMMIVIARLLSASQNGCLLASIQSTKEILLTSLCQKEFGKKLKAGLAMVAKTLAYMVSLTSPFWLNGNDSKFGRFLVSFVQSK